MWLSQFKINPSSLLSPLAPSSDAAVNVSQTTSGLVIGLTLGALILLLLLVLIVRKRRSNLSENIDITAQSRHSGLQGQLRFARSHQSAAYTRLPFYHYDRSEAQAEALLRGENLVDGTFLVIPVLAAYGHDDGSLSHMLLVAHKSRVVKFIIKEYGSGRMTCNGKDCKSIADDLEKLILKLQLQPLFGVPVALGTFVVRSQDRNSSAAKEAEMASELNRYGSFAPPEHLQLQQHPDHLDSMSEEERRRISGLYSKVIKFREPENDATARKASVTFSNVTSYLDYTVASPETSAFHDDNAYSAHDPALGGSFSSSITDSTTDSNAWTPARTDYDNIPEELAAIRYDSFNTTKIDRPLSTGSIASSNASDLFMHTHYAFTDNQRILRQLHDLDSNSSVQGSDSVRSSRSDQWLNANARVYGSNSSSPDHNPFGAPPAFDQPGVSLQQLDISDPFPSEESMLELKAFEQPQRWSVTRIEEEEEEEEDVRV